MLFDGRVIGLKPTLDKDARKIDNIGLTTNFGFRRLWPINDAI